MGGEMNLFQNTPDFLLILVGVLVLVATILILASGRRDEDTGGTRTQTRYVGAIGIITLFVALVAFYNVVRGLTGFIVDGHDDNSIYRHALENGLLLIAAGVVFMFHYQRCTALAPAGKVARGATGAVARATHYSVCFVAAVIALVAASKAVYGIFQIIAPGVFGGGDGINAVPPGGDLPPALEEFSGEFFDLGGGGGDVARQQGIADLLSYGSLALASVLIFLRSWNWLPEHR
ncbi:MAG: hypothetical protein WEA49_09200 [Acidimicrobiia bacterium]